MNEPDHPECDHINNCESCYLIAERLQAQLKRAEQRTAELEGKLASFWEKALKMVSWGHGYTHVEVFPHSQMRILVNCDVAKDIYARMMACTKADGIEDALFRLWKQQGDHGGTDTPI